VRLESKIRDVRGMCLRSGSTINGREAIRVYSEGGENIVSARPPKQHASRVCSPDSCHPWNPWSVSHTV